MSPRAINAAFATLLALTAGAFVLADTGANPTLLWTIVGLKCLIVQGVFMVLTRAMTVWAALGLPTLMVIAMLALPLGG